MPKKGIAVTTDEKTDKGQDVYRRAYERFAQSSNWVKFYREVLGVGGIVRRAFPTREELAEFEKTEEFSKIQQMLAKLREQPVPWEAEEPTKVITVRLPKSLHDAIRAEAHEHQTSMNKLCISKLMQFIDKQIIPEEESGVEP